MIVRYSSGSKSLFETSRLLQRCEITNGGDLYFPGARWRKKLSDSNNVFAFIIISEIPLKNAYARVYFYCWMFATSYTGLFTLRHNIALYTLCVSLVLTVLYITANIIQLKSQYISVERNVMVHIISNSRPLCNQGLYIF